MKKIEEQFVAFLKVSVIIFGVIAIAMGMTSAIDSSRVETAAKLENAEAYIRLLEQDLEILHPCYINDVISETDEYNAYYAD